MALWGSGHSRRTRLGTYAALLVVLATWVFVVPVVGGDAPPLLLHEVALLVLLLSSVAAAAERPHEMGLLLLFAGASLLLSILGAAGTSGGPGLGVAAALVRAAFCAVMCVAILRHVLSHERVTADRILGAIAVYILLAVLFAFAYTALLHLDGGAIARAPGSPDSGDAEAAPFADLTYFSIVTLTTLGYGDVVPRSAAARSLAQFEAMGGQVYVAVVLAWLVGMHLAHRRPPHGGEGASRA